MGLVFSWWLVVELLGLVSLPLAATALGNLPDRGWALAKPLGMIALGWLIWFPLSVVTALPYSAGWIFGTFLAFALLNAMLLRRPATRAALRDVWTRARAHVLASEALFLLAFIFMAWVRAFAPDVRDTEKFMDVAFISSLWRTPHLPAPDPWLSGLPINYYYFGHFLVATLAKLLGTQPGTAFNLGVALVFALVAVAVYGVAANLTAAVTGSGAPRLARALPFGLAAVVLVLIAGNLNGAQVWQQDALKAVTDTPALHGNPWAWWQDRALWVTYDWWSPSRVIPLATGGTTINEFPAFSFVLADLHAHVLALPFAVLAVGIALNLLLARGEGLRLFGSGRSRWVALVTCAVALGSLYAINGWDMPTYLGLALLAIAVQQWLAHGRRLSGTFALNAVAAGASLAALCLLAYVPFYRAFVSPSQGFAPVAPADRTPVGYELAIFGLPLFILFTLLIVWLVRWAGELAERSIGPSPVTSTRARPSPLDAVATPRVLGGAVAALVLLVLVLLTARSPDNQGWTLFWCLALLLVCGALAWQRIRGVPRDDATDAADGETATPAIRAEVWLLCLVGVSAALVAACELLYLRDIFDSRMNTVFKLYYQVWLLLGLAAAPALALLWRGATRYARTLRAAFVAAPSAAPVADPAPVTLAAAAVAVSRSPLSAGAAGVVESPAVRDGDSGILPEDAPGAPPVPVALQCVGAAGMLVWTGLLLVLVGAALMYPVLAFSARTNNFGWRPGGSPAGGDILSASDTPLTLDGTAYMADDSPQDPADCRIVGAGSNHADNYAIDWLNRNVSGSPVILEAPGCEWTRYSRISAFTGLPTLLGWPGGHEGEWRVNWLPQQPGDVFGERTNAINTIYTSADEHTVLALLHTYHVRYVYVGAAERNLYATADLTRFGSYLRTVYQRDGVTIYAVP